MNLFLFPEAACNTNGYGIAIAAAYERLNIQKEDVVVWVTNHPLDQMLYYRESDYIIPRPRIISYKSIINTLRKTNRSEPLQKDLKFLVGKTFDNIYCDETIFYHPIRKLFPKQHITIRFHNCFARIYDRLKLLNRKVDAKYHWILYSMYQLEREVMNDSNTYKIFITEEDRNYYTSHFGKNLDSEVFDFQFSIEQILVNRIPLSLDKRIIWYGGVEPHKKSSICWFIEYVFPSVRQVFPDIEFHLWGKNTEQFDNPSSSIFGHGFFDGDGLPSNCSLYVNPDVIGGGIKIKLMSLLKCGVPVISSPFGFEGYSKSFIDNKYCIVKEEAEWSPFIIDYLKLYFK